MAAPSSPQALGSPARGGDRTRWTDTTPRGFAMYGRPTATSLMELAMRHGAANGFKRGQCVVGIDACAAVRHHQHLPDNQAQMLLFERCCFLNGLPTARPFFVFDGNGPLPAGMTRADDYPTCDHSLSKALLELVLMFGFAFHMSEGEAAADLAHLDQAGKLSVVLTDDIYPLLYGARSVTSWVRQDGDGGRRDDTVVEVQSFAGLNTVKDHKLSREDLVLAVLLTGGKHSKGVGIPAEIALKLPGYDIASRLAEIATHAAEVGRELTDIRLDYWRAHLRLILATDPDGILGNGASVALANRITADFPPLDLVVAYLRPEPTWVTPVPCDRGMDRLNIPVVGAFYRARFAPISGRRADDLVLDGLQDKLWPSVAIQMLVDICHFGRLPPLLYSVPSNMISLTDLLDRNAAGSPSMRWQDVLAYEFSVDVTPLSSALGIQQGKQPDRQRPPIKAWIPRTLFEAAVGADLAKVWPEPHDRRVASGLRGVLSGAQTKSVAQASGSGTVQEAGAGVAAQSGSSEAETEAVLDDSVKMEE